MVGIYIAYWVTGAGFEIEKDLELSPKAANCSKKFLKIIVYIYIYIVYMPLFISVSWPSVVT